MISCFRSQPINSPAGSSDSGSKGKGPPTRGGRHQTFFLPVGGLRESGTAVWAHYPRADSGLLARLGTDMTGTAIGTEFDWILRGFGRCILGTRARTQCSGVLQPNQPGPCSRPTGQVARNRHLKVVPSTPRIYYHSVQSGRPSLGRAREPERTLQRGTTTTSPAIGPGHTHSAYHLTPHSLGRATGRLGGHSPSVLANASTKCFTPGRPREHPGGGSPPPRPSGPTQTRRQAAAGRSRLPSRAGPD